MPPTRLRSTGGVRPLLTALRPRQWIKNVLVLLAPLAAGELLEPGTLLRSVAMLMVFCAVSGGLYLHNDLRDRNTDVLDPRTAGRPIAGGTLAVDTARRAALSLSALALGGAWLLGTGPLLAVVVYAALTFLYSVGLKRIPYLELLIVASGFLLRTVAGAAAGTVPVSSWFLVVIGAAAILVVTAKRTAEIIDGHSRRTVLMHYTPGRLSVVRRGALVCTIAGYTFWATSQTGGSWAYLSVLVLGAVLLRFEQQAMQGRVAEPETYVLRDPLIVIGGIVWFGVFLLTLIGGQ